MMTFDGSYEVYQDLKKDNLWGEDRLNAIKYICGDGYYSYNLIQDRLYKNKQELDIVIESTIFENRYGLTLLLDHRDLLTFGQREYIIDNQMRSPYLASDLLKAVKKGKIHITAGQKRRAIDMVKLSLDQVIWIITKEEYEKEVRDEVAETFGYNKEVARRVIQSLGRKENPYRAIYFRTVARDCDISYDFAVEGKLFDDEKEIIYNKYFEYYRDKCGTGFKKFFEYCTLFGKCLNDDDQEKLVKKLLKSSYQEYISLARSRIKFNQKSLDIFQGLEIKNKLAG